MQPANWLCPPNELPAVSHAPYRLGAGETGYFIAILGRDGDNYIVGDLLIGKRIQSPSELRGEYEFTGFFMVVR
jgi:hypothetical protein